MKMYEKKLFSLKLFRSSSLADGAAPSYWKCVVGVCAGGQLGGGGGGEGGKKTGKHLPNGDNRGLVFKKELFSTFLFSNPACAVLFSEPRIRKSSLASPQLSLADFRRQDLDSGNFEVRPELAI